MVFAAEVFEAGSGQEKVCKHDEIDPADVGGEGYFGGAARSAGAGLDFVGIAPVDNADDFNDWEAFLEIVGK